MNSSLILCAVLLSLFSNCVGRNTENANNIHNGISERNTSNKCIDMREASPIWLKSALERISQKGAYRIAKAEDFSFNQVKIENEFTIVDIKRWENCPVISTDLNFDTNYDLIMILVNDSIKDNKKYSIVIINAPSNEKNETINPYFLYQDADLSKTYIDKWSGGVIIRNYQEDGKFTSCYVNWNKKSHTYTCDSKYAP